MAFLEGLGPFLVWRLDRYVRRGASMCDDERKRREMLNRDRVSDIRHA